MPSVAQGQLPEHLKSGAALMQGQRYPEAITAFEEAVTNNPEDGWAWYYLGLAYHSNGDLDQALRGHLLASKLAGPNDVFGVNSTYNMACAYALQGKDESALRWLHRARNIGFGNFGLVGSDTDLASLREDPRFDAFLASGRLGRPLDSSAAVTSVTQVMPGGTGGVAVREDGALFVANFGGEVWRVEKDGTWEVFATGFTKSADCVFDAKGNLLQADHGTGKVWSIAPDGTRTDLALEGLNSPVGIDLASDGTMFITNFRDNSIWRVDPDGSSRRIVSGGLLNGPNGIAVAGDLGVFVVNYKDGVVVLLDPESGAQSFVCELPGSGSGHVSWTGSELIITARTAHQLYRVSPEGGIRLVAGTGQQGSGDGGAASSTFSLPNGIALSPDGRVVFVNDRLSGNRSVIRRVELLPGQ